MTDTDDETWTTADIANAVHAESLSGDAFVVRELTRRMAEQFSGVRRADPGMMALDLSHVLASLATVADTLIAEWMSDLDDEERSEGAAGLAERLRECAAILHEISGSF
jgi:hypothetical protein